MTALSCSLKAETRTVLIEPGTRLGRIYGGDQALERFNCSSGLNERYREAFMAKGMVISAKGEEGEARAVELPDHPFFMATLYMPQLSSTEESSHPLIRAFVEAAAATGC